MTVSNRKPYHLAERPSQNERTNIDISILPDELIMCIFSFLGGRELSRVQIVNKLWQNISKESLLWGTYLLKASKGAEGFWSKINKEKENNKDKNFFELTGKRQGVVQRTATNLECFKTLPCIEGRLAFDQDELVQVDTKGVVSRYDRDFVLKEVELLPCKEIRSLTREGSRILGGCTSFSESNFWDYNLDTKRVRFFELTFSQAEDVTTVSIHKGTYYAGARNLIHAIDIETAESRKIYNNDRSDLMEIMFADDTMLTVNNLSLYREQEESEIFKDGDISFYDTRSTNFISSFKTDHVYCATLLDKTVALGHWSKIEIRDLRKLDEACQQISKAEVSGVALKGDMCLATCKNNINIYSLITGEEIAILKGHSSPITSLISPSNGPIFSQTANEIKIWR